MSRLEMSVGEKTLTFRYDVQALCEIEEDHGTLDALLDKMSGEDKPTQAQLYLIACTANAGARFRAEAETVTPEWLRDHLSPGQLVKARVMAQAAIMVGMHRENALDDDGDVDETLEEIRKKKEQKTPAAG